MQVSCCLSRRRLARGSGALVGCADGLRSAMAGRKQRKETESSHSSQAMLRPYLKYSFGRRWEDGGKEGGGKGRAPAKPVLLWTSTCDMRSRETRTRSRHQHHHHHQPRLEAASHSLCATRMEIGPSECGKITFLYKTPPDPPRSSPFSYQIPR